MYTCIIFSYYLYTKVSCLVDIIGGHDNINQVLFTLYYQILFSGI